ncbi:MAG: hypothetical protein LBC02_01640 [Planctomycetaceae bacterium]|nr:hypothetical protein [Planctomycetaceae bacterium]
MICINYRMYFVLKGHCLTTHRNAVGTKFLHCPFRAIVSCSALPTALRWVVTHCPYRGEK